VIRRLLPLLLASALLMSALAAIVPATAGADALDEITAAFLKHGGTLAPCEFTVKTLHAALDEQETGYNAEYLEIVSSAINAALDAQASEGCGSQAGQAAPTKASVAAIPGGSGGEPRSVTAATDAGIPAPIAVLALITAVLALGVATTAVGRRRGWDPLWLADWRHASAEAGFRLGNAWAQLADRVRSGGR
jgi:hypothetical protein